MASINTDVSKVNLVYADRDGIWTDHHTTNELVI